MEKKLKKVWVVVVSLFLIDSSLLFFNSNFDGDESGKALGQSIEEDTQAFDRLSYWEEFLKNKKAQDAKEIKLSKFDGLEIDPEYEESVVIVMVDNFVTARPQQSGIRAASVVYEALAEGGITRLMLVFPYQEISRVGPVRSARDYFVDFAEEYGGVFAHAGGSPLALEKLFSSNKLYNLDEDDRLEGETYSFRDEHYRAPHNLYFDLLPAREKALKENWPIVSKREAWCFDADDMSGQPVTNIRIDFANDKFSDSFVQFTYDAEQKNYKRFYGSADPLPHTDQLDALQVAPSNLIVQVAPSNLIEGDEKERLSFQHIGKGTFFLYRNGQKVIGNWEKSSSGAATKFFDEQGRSMCLQPGQVWIALVDGEELVGDYN